MVSEAPPSSPLVLWVVLLEHLEMSHRLWLVSAVAHGVEVGLQVLVVEWCLSLVVDLGFKLVSWFAVLVHRLDLHFGYRSLLNLYLLIMASAFQLELPLQVD